MYAPKLDHGVGGGMFNNGKNSVVNKDAFKIDMPNGGFNYRNNQAGIVNTIGAPNIKQWDSVNMQSEPGDSYGASYLRNSNPSFVNGAPSEN